MGEIKSALDMAMERTKDIEAEKSLIINEKAEEDGKRSVFKFIENSTLSLEDLKKKLKGYKGEQKEIFREGMVKTLLANLVIPDKEKSGIDKTERIRDALILCSDETASFVKEVFRDLKDFFSQYIKNKEAVKENIKERIAPQIMEKQQAVSKKLGMNIEISVEDDPDFEEALSKTTVQLQQKYNSILNQIKTELRTKILKK